MTNYLEKNTAVRWYIYAGCILALSIALLISAQGAYGDHSSGGGLVGTPVTSGSNCCAYINLTGASGGIQGGNWALIQL